MKEAENILINHNVRPTANRIIVLDTLLKSHNPISISDIEIAIETIDKSTIFRTLTTFLNHEIVHAIEDGSGALKYEVCHGQEHCTPADRHVHFYCEKCGRTYCLESTGIPEVMLPDGFVRHSINYIVKGICRKCNV